jgi:polyisoprenoid-binding protein YceI
MIALVPLIALLAACASPTPTAPPRPTVAQAPAVEATATVAVATQREETDTQAPPTPAGGAQVYTIDPAQSVALYKVGEIFINRNNTFNLAIGATNAAQGQITLNAADPAQTHVGTITIDISTLASDSSRRDNMIRQNWLESSKFPIVTFTPTELRGLPNAYTPGTELTFEIVGDMLVRDTTRPVTFAVTATLSADNVLTGLATTTIKMSDFNFSAPDIAGILKADDEAALEFRFVAKP